MRVDGSRIRKEKVADSKISGYVWTGPQKESTANFLGFLICLKLVHAGDSRSWRDFFRRSRTKS